MTVFRTALVVLAVVASMGAPAFAATDDAGEERFERDVEERECTFAPELGGYRCESFNAGGSLSELGDANKKKLLWIPQIIILP